MWRHSNENLEFKSFFINAGILKNDCDYKDKKEANKEYSEKTEKFSVFHKVPQNQIIEFTTVFALSNTNLDEEFTFFIKSVEAIWKM